MKEDILKNLKTKTVLLCEACGGYHPEDECEIVLVKIIKGKDCALNMTKEQTFARPTKSVTEAPRVVTGREDIPDPAMPAGPVREIVPPGIKKQDPRLIRPSVVGPPGMRIPSMADIMKEPGA
jgi:hypothetical protein